MDYDLVASYACRCDACRDDESGVTVGVSCTCWGRGSYCGDATCRVIGGALDGTVPVRGLVGCYCGP